MKRGVALAVLLATIALLTASCGTPYRYEYYDYGEKSIDEKNRAREEEISRRFRGVVPASSAVRRWGR